MSSRAIGAEGPAPSSTPPVILVVDDDSRVLSVAGRLLERLGYAVLTAHGPREALELHEKRGPVDLLLTDLTMPGMSGTELVESLSARQPSLRAVVMSGHPVEELKDSKVRAWIQKPLTLEVLSRVLGAELER